MKTALTIAGSDSGGGAGVQADLKSFMAHKVHGMSVLTAVTAQNTVGVQGVWPLPLEAVEAQVRSVFADLPVGAVKTGMLATGPLVSLVARLLAEHHSDGPLVVDPVMVATSGDRLLEDDALEAVRGELLPLATVITPNAAEASVLLGGQPVESLEDARQAARALGTLGCGAVLVKGGHLAGGEHAVDVLWDGTQMVELALPWVETRSTHGTGCTLAASIAANLALGLGLRAAVESAKAYLPGALERASGLGGGHGPVNHHWRLV